MGIREHEVLKPFEDLNEYEADVSIFASEEEDESDNSDDEPSILSGADNVLKTCVLMVGLDNAGKTKLLYTLDGDVVEDIAPTSRYNALLLKYNENNYKIWDIGGHINIRNQRHLYVENKSSVIYVVDASDATRFEEAQEDLHDIMNNSRLSDVPLVILANKLDLAPEFVVQDLVKHLKLENIKQKWVIHGCSAATDGEKLFEIFELLKQ